MKQYIIHITYNSHVHSRVKLWFFNVFHWFYSLNTIHNHRITVLIFSTRWRCNSISLLYSASHEQPLTRQIYLITYLLAQHLQKWIIKAALGSLWNASHQGNANVIFTACYIIILICAFVCFFVKFNFTADLMKLWCEIH